MSCCCWVLPRLCWRPSEHIKIQNPMVKQEKNHDLLKNWCKNMWQTILRRIFGSQWALLLYERNSFLNLEERVVLFPLSSVASVPSVPESVKNYISSYKSPPNECGWKLKILTIVKTNQFFKLLHKMCYVYRALLLLD